MSKLIVNCETGETVERELNKAEKDQEKIDEAAIAIIKTEAETKATAKATAQGKLAALGLTLDDLRALGL